MSNAQATGLWVRVAKDVSAAVGRLVGYWQVQGLSENGRVRVRSFDPEHPGEREVRRLRGLAVAAGDGVITLRLPGLFEVALGVILRDDEEEITPSVPEHTHPVDRLFEAKSTVAATVSSTTDTVNYQEAIGVNIDLPDGAWKLKVTAQGNFSHSASGSMNRAVEIDGNLMGAGTITLTATRETYPTATNRGQIAGNRRVLCRLLYRSNSAGTTGCRAPLIEITAERE